MRNCPTCLTELIRIQCGGPTTCEHGMFLSEDCDECAPYRWKCVKCGFEITPGPAEDVVAERVDALIKAIAVLAPRITVSVGPPGRIKGAVTLESGRKKIAIDEESLCKMSTERLAHITLEEWYGNCPADTSLS